MTAIQAIPADVLERLAGLRLEKVEAEGDAARYDVTFPPGAAAGAFTEIELSAVARAAVDSECGADAGSSASAPATLDQEARFLCAPAAFEGIHAEVRALGRMNGVSRWRVGFHDRGNGNFAEVTVTKADRAGARPDRAKARQRPKETAAEPSEPSGRPRQAPALGVRREAIAEKRIQQIIRGGYAVISRKGFGNASTREIADAAGMPIPTMYHYIQSKDDLLSMIFDYFAGQLADDLHDMLSRSADITDTLENSINEYIKYCGKNRKYINLIYRETINLNKQARETLFSLDKSFTRIWRDILQAGADSGEFDVDQPELVAEFIYFLCTIWAIRYWSLRSFPEAQVAGTLTTFILRGVGVPHEAGDAARRTPDAKTPGQPPKR